jgi:hypothetical protein
MAAFPWNITANTAAAIRGHKFFSGFSDRSGKKIQGKKMVGRYSQSTDDLFAPDLFAILFVPTGLRTENREQKD